MAFATASCVNWIKEKMLKRWLFSIADVVTINWLGLDIIVNHGYMTNIAIIN